MNDDYVVRYNSNTHHGEVLLHVVYKMLKNVEEILSLFDKFFRKI